MRKIIGLFALGWAVLATGAVAPVPPAGDGRVSEHFYTVTEQSTDITGNAVACTTVGGATCTSILPATALVGWGNVTLYIKNTDAADTIADVQIEVSPDNSNWAEVVSGSCDALVAGAMCVANYTGHYAYIRIAARSAANTSTKVWITGIRP